MEIGYKNSSLKKLFESDRKLQGKYGSTLAKKICRRMDLLRWAKDLAEISTKGRIRCHPLTGDWNGHFAIGIEGGYRLVFRIGHDPVPTFEKEGIDFSAVTYMIVVDIVNYH